jgi:TPP-dependent pyruvate/acetoin dehydrogenase alpha subunit
MEGPWITASIYPERHFPEPGLETLMELGNSQRLWMYKTMVKSREFELAIKSIYLEGKQPVFNMARGPIPGEMHLSNGQEPCAVGICAHLQSTDSVTSTHRPHHVAIAKGVDLNAMAAEIFGRTRRPHSSVRCEGEFLLFRHHRAGNGTGCRRGDGGQTAWTARRRGFVHR